MFYGKAKIKIDLANKMRFYKILLSFNDNSEYFQFFSSNKTDGNYDYINENTEYKIAIYGKIVIYKGGNIRIIDPCLNSSEDFPKYYAKIVK